MPGNYQMGLNLRTNKIRLNEGACVELDGSGWLAYFGALVRATSHALS